MVSNNLNKRAFGTLGEKIASEFLAKSGYKIIYHNYRVGKLGEIDIIAIDREYICFIEVKTRTSTYFGMPSEAVTTKKQATIHKIASIYLNQHKLYNRNVRFDIVEIIGSKNESNFEVKTINLIQNAF